MNEFEWRRQLRDLRQPLTPPPDLWSSLDAALTRGEHDSAAFDDTPTTARHRSRPRWLLGALAASLILVGSIAWRTIQTPSIVPAAVAKASPSQWKPSDPRLAGAAIELSAAKMELKLALDQAPDSPALQRLLDRTEMQQTQLRQRSHQAG
jgi:hypothetical protein